MQAKVTEVMKFFSLNLDKSDTDALFGLKDYFFTKVFVKLTNWEQTSGNIAKEQHDNENDENVTVKVLKEKRNELSER